MIFVRETARGIFKQWRMSIRDFFSYRGKIFLGVTLWNFVQATRSLLYGWWLFFPMKLVSSLFFTNTFLYIGATRPTICNKELGYFFFYALVSLPFFLGAYALYPFLGSWWSFHFFPFFIFLIVSLFDTGGYMKELLPALWRALRMYVKTYPFCFVFAVISYAWSFWMAKVALFFGGSMAIIISGSLFTNFVAVPCTVCFFTNFYLKTLHEEGQQFS